MILLLKLVAEKSATTFGDLPDCLVNLVYNKEYNSEWHKHN